MTDAKSFFLKFFFFAEKEKQSMKHGYRYGTQIQHDTGAPALI